MPLYALYPSFVHISSPAEDLGSHSASVEDSASASLNLFKIVFIYLFIHTILMGSNL